MRIALFHSTLPEIDRKPGGVEMTVHLLANELARVESDVTVFSLTPPPNDALYAHVQLFSHFGWLYRFRVMRILVLPLLLNFVAFSRFDVVHFHGDDWFLFRRKNFVSVRTMHGSALEEARSATSLLRRVSQYVIYPLERLSVALSDVTLAIGTQTAQLYGIDTVVDNGVDHSKFNPGSKSPHPTVLFVGTWHGRKRGAFLFERFVTDVAPQLPEARLAMVSDECPEHPQVDWVNNPDSGQLASLYRESWVFAYPSTYEGFGLPYLEAMASGTAVLCSENNAAQYLLDHGNAGEIVGDSQFASALHELLTDTQRRERLETMGLARASEFSWAVVAQTHRQIFERAVAGS